jgi:lipid-A-disaccharide synthase
MKYYLIAGEASGDLHGSNLMKSLKKADPQAEFRFWGGDLMKDHGGEPVKHIRELAYMGLDVILHLRAIFRNMKLCKNDVLSWKPDVLIFIDYPGFNLPVAEFAHNNGIRTFYYISPKVWAWKESRVKKIKQYIDQLFVIFPFEVEYFKKFGIEAQYFGNPLADAIHEFKQRKTGSIEFIKRNNLENKPIIALLAGSRKGEITSILPEMIKAVRDKDNFQYVIAGAPSIGKHMYENILQNTNIKVVYNQTYDLISNSTLAIVTSGTATLETALLKTPEVVVFKTNFPTFVVGKILVGLKYFSLVNLIMNKEVVAEFLQLNLAERIKQAIDKILNDPQYKQQMLKDFDEIERRLGIPGVSDRIAEKMISLLS